MFIFSESPNTNNAKMIPYTGSKFMVSIMVKGENFFNNSDDAVNAYAVQIDPNIKI